MAALVAAAAAPDFPASVKVVIGDRAAAQPGLSLASRGRRRGFGARRQRAAAPPSRRRSTPRCAPRGIELICLAGFMRILGADFVGRWRALNIHPSLLPAFKGLDTHARALAAGVAEHGCTVHWVTAELDAGEIVAQARVPVRPGDDPETLAARVLVAEHALYPEALRTVCERLQAAPAAP